MSERTPSKDEALEALDFIVNVLKEHEKDLDKLISELGTVANQLGESGEINNKVAKIEDKINNMQNEISNLIKHLSALPRETRPAAVAGKFGGEARADEAEAAVANNPPLALRCKQWEDFRELAVKARTVAFVFNEAERTFEVDALKDNQITTYSGELPKLGSLLKMWLSKQLEIPEKQVLEGVLSLG